jgi:MOSC domain-containing protein YiiM
MRQADVWIGRREIQATMTWKGSVVSIQIAARAGGDMQPVESVKAVAGKGLLGDRYFEATGTYSKKDGPDREVTLIEIEAIEGLERDYGVKLEPRNSRRNIVTRGVPLNHLVDQEFRVGEVVLRGIRLCEPCGHLAEVAQAKVLPGLVHRGGLRAQVVREGVIRIGDSVEP